MDITIKDILVAASGKKDNRTKSSIGLFSEIWGADGSKRTIYEIDLDKPVINISKHGDFVTIDLAFGTHLDADYRQCYHLLENFFAAENSEEDNAEEIPMLVLSIVPHEYNGLYYCLAFNPIMWTIAPSAPSEEYADTIRLVYASDDFTCYKSEEEPDLETIKAEAQEEVEKQYAELTPSET